MVLVSNPFGGWRSKTLWQLKSWISQANNSWGVPMNPAPVFWQGTPATTGTGGTSNALAWSWAPSTLSGWTYLDTIKNSTQPTQTGSIASRMLTILKGQKAWQDAAIEEANKNILVSARKFKAALWIDTANQENAAANWYGLRGGTFAQQQSAVNNVRNQAFAKALQLEWQTANSIAWLAWQKAQLETQVWGQALNVIAQTELADEQQRKQQAAQEALYRLQASLK